MIDNFTNARWLAIAGVVVGLSACAACFLVVLVLSSVYGGQTVALRNPLAAPTAVVNVPSGGSTSSDGAVSGGAGSVPADSGGASSGGAGSVPSGGSMPTGGDAANYLPTLPGYATANASSIQGAIDLIAGTGGFSGQSAGDTFSAQSLSGIATAVIVSRVDDFIACYRRTGAVDARVYIQADIAAIAGGGVPPLGAVAVINQDRLRESLVDCAVTASGADGFSAQSANQPCGDFGSFTRNGETFSYLYAGTSQDFCNQVDGYYTRLGG